MKYLIIDDEPHARDRMRFLMQEYLDFQYSGEAENGIEAIEMIESVSPDLIFLDIEMPGLNGFDVLRQLRVKTLPMIIFVTAFDQYAIQAFEVEALDYLVKPVSSKRLEQTLRRVQKIQHNQQFQQIASLLKGIEHQTEPLNRIPARLGHKLKLIPLLEVLWFVLEDRIVFVQTVEEKLPTHFETLKELESRLNEGDFFRINRNHIVQLSHISEVIPFGSSLFRIIIPPYENIPLEVSREQTKKLKKLLDL